MKIYISNFLRNVSRYFRENRARLIKWALIAVAALIALLLIRHGVEKIQKWSYERGVAAKEREFREADARAKEHQARADALKVEIEVREAERRELEARARAAEWKLTETRRAVAPLKEAYEKARDNPDVPADTTCADACKELAALGHECK